MTKEELEKIRRVHALAFKVGERRWTPEEESLLNEYAPIDVTTMLLKHIDLLNEVFEIQSKALALATKLYETGK